MRPVSETPTEAADYAALSALYGALLAATAVTSRDCEPVPRGELPVLAAASFALSKLIVHEKVESWIRQPFVDERAGVRHRGRRRRIGRRGRIGTRNRRQRVRGHRTRWPTHRHAPETSRGARRRLGNEEEGVRLPNDVEGIRNVM